MKKRKYTCMFRLLDTEPWEIVEADPVLGISAFTDGFWIDTDRNWTQDRDKYWNWVPPHAISHIHCKHYEENNEEEKHET